MDSAPLPCDVHAHLMLKWPIHGTIVFQSCQGKVQNGAHFLLPGVITTTSTLPLQRRSLLSLLRSAQEIV